MQGKEIRRLALDWKCLWVTLAAWDQLHQWVENWEGAEVTGSEGRA